MNSHAFIFKPGYWLGEGKVTFDNTKEHIHFYTRWVIEPEEDGLIICSQQVEMQGAEDVLSNRYSFSNIRNDSCIITIENELVSSVTGRCVIEPKTIAWEFRGHETMEGFEVFQLQDNGDYMFHAEYAGNDQFRTHIDGRIWIKHPSS